MFVRITCCLDSRVLRRREVSGWRWIGPICWMSKWCTALSMSFWKKLQQSAMRSEQWEIAICWMISGQYAPSLPFGPWSLQKPWCNWLRWNLTTGCVSAPEINVMLWEVFSGLSSWKKMEGKSWVANCFGYKSVGDAFPMMELEGSLQSKQKAVGYYVMIDLVALTPDL